MNKLSAQLLFVPTLAWNMLLGRYLRVRRWWDRVDDHVIIGALPFPSDVPRLRDEGVRGVVNTCLEYAGPQRGYESAGIEQHRMPTVDFTHPELADVEKAVEFIKGHADKDQSVYVHCKAGRARSATVVLCWLIQEHGMTPEQGQKLLLEKRPHVNPKLVERPVVQTFFEKHSGT
ncbi:MAG: phosphatidylglycerophosphatase and protein-tyrosine phosphatase 1 family protein [Planctomycetota bacterium]|nr:phosphatidylglycerophosphatase and protein-tyrosine phosphatase 1 family protein [Planctomycetota bacterium]MEC9147883.1 phosphatidylglycerophosphatase and protein-tyrosine phosphatase 1 family protein [Planctomycetota bacterium]MEE3032078.1 phosphatidylglycerophosphatase and protein-tyrosine phosphatase 1 family protein [Planctomycetota bacterium]MEE3075699.1 phosphatidylglycerophosphatase and protein-tyrosine phosphatase 1 family protein [Planctomycetota bacterium]